MPIINKGIFDTNDAFLRQTGNDWPTAQIISTSDVIESASNLYFTNARVASNVATLLKSFEGTGLSIDAANGQINILASASAPTANVANFATLANFANTAGFANTATTANTVLTLSNFTTANLAEGVNLYYNNSRVLSAVTPLLTTANVIESASNLYFTAARVNATVQPFLTSANVTESAGNLYFTTARANAAIWPSLTTANVTETSSNLYFTYARANATIWPSLTAANIANFASLANATIWPSLTTANVSETSGNLYFTAARANAAIWPSLTAANISNFNSTANAVIYPSLTAANIANFVSTVNTTVQPFLTTANVIETGINQYFTNTKARSAFSAGKGINIDLNGVIKNTGGDIFYNLNLDGAAGGNVLSTMTSFITFSTAFTSDRFMVRSIHIANMSNDIAYVSANIVYAGTGQTIPLGVQVPVPLGGVTEFLPRYQIFQPGDSIQLQGFNAAGAATANIMSATIAYDTQSADITFVGNGISLSTVNTNQLIYNSSSAYSIIENLKFVNTISTPVKVSTYWGDANGVPISYLVYGMSVPPNSAVEVLQAAKRINLNDRLYASYTGATNGAVSAFVSARLGSVYAIGSYSTTTVPAGNAILSFASTDPDGTIIYYTIE
jgi:hypothetical protein